MRLRFFNFSEKYSVTNFFLIGCISEIQKFFICHYSESGRNLFLWMVFFSLFEKNHLQKQIKKSGEAVPKENDIFNTGCVRGFRT